MSKKKTKTEERLEEMEQEYRDAMEEVENAQGLFEDAEAEVEERQDTADEILRDLNRLRKARGMDPLADDKGQEVEPFYTTPFADE